MLPGILLITIASGIAYTAYRLFLDLQGGIFERFQSMPIARSSVLWAHVLTSLVANLVSIAIVIGVALIMGFRTGASVGAWLAVAGILVLFTLALTWLAVIAGLSAKTVDGASAFSYPLIFLPFISSAFVPTASMPGPVAWFAEHQPVTSIVDTMRALFAEQPVGSDIWIALAWLVGILVVAYAARDREVPAPHQLSAPPTPRSTTRESPLLAPEGALRGPEVATHLMVEDGRPTAMGEQRAPRSATRSRRRSSRSPSSRDAKPPRLPAVGERREARLR